MKRLVGVLLFCACSGAMPGPVDSGTTVDAGADCQGVPARLTQYTCIAMGQPGAARCEPSAEAALAAHFQGCDAGPGILGHASVGECGSGLVAVRWVYGPPGDTLECIYPNDGGAAVGGINYGERGVFVSGQVGDCTTVAPATCP